MTKLSDLEQQQIVRAIAGVTHLEEFDVKAVLGVLDDLGMTIVRKTRHADIQFENRRPEFYPTPDRVVPFSLNGFGLGK